MKCHTRPLVYMKYHMARHMISYDIHTWYHIYLVYECYLQFTYSGSIISVKSRSGILYHTGQRHRIIGRILYHLFFFTGLLFSSHGAPVPVHAKSYVERESATAWRGSAWQLRVQPRGRSQLCTAGGERTTSGVHRSVQDTYQVPYRSRQQRYENVYRQMRY